MNEENPFSLTVREGSLEQVAFERNPTGRTSAGARRRRESQQREREPKRAAGSGTGCRSGKLGQGPLRRACMPAQC